MSGPEVDVDAAAYENGGQRELIGAEGPADADYFEQLSPLAEPNGLLNDAGMVQPMMDNDMQFLFTASKQAMVNGASKVLPVSIPTACDVLCTTNTVINYVVPTVEITFKDTVGILPYKGRKTNRITKLTKGETPWQKYKMSGARIDRNEDLHRERDEFMEKLETEKYEKNFVRFVLACRIQALFRGYVSRLHRPKGDNRRLKPMPYVPRRKAKFVIRPAVLQDELCELASFLNLNPIPGLNLVSKTKASKRMKKIQLAAAIRLTKFFRLIVAKKKCKQIVETVRKDRQWKAAITVARFFKSLKLRTFAYRSKMEKRRRAVVKIQNLCRKWHANGRVRVLRREVRRLRVVKHAAIVLQRSFKRVYGPRVYARMVLAKEAMAAIEPSIHEQSFEEAVDMAAEDVKEDFITDQALEDALDGVWGMLLEELVEEEEQHHIMMAVQRAAAEAARLERERVALELELARQKKVEEERLRREEEERHRLEELRRKREEERKEKERLRQAELERIRIEEEATRVAAEAEAVAKKAAEEAVTLAEYAELTSTMGSTMARLHAEEPVVDSKEMEELMEFKKTLDSQKAADAANTRVWSLATPKDPANAFLGIEKQAREFKSVEEETADDLSAFYISQALEKSRPDSSQTSVARRSVSQILEDAKAKATELAEFHTIKSPHKHYSMGTISDIMKESKRLVVMRASPFFAAYQLLGSAKVFYTGLEHANAITLVNEAAEKVKAALDNGKDEEGVDLSDNMRKFGRYIDQELRLLRGLCEMAVCDYTRAQRTLEEGLAISNELFGSDYHPGHFEVEMGLVTCLVYLGEHENAIKKLEKLRAEQETYAKLTHGLGTDVSQLGGVPPSSLIETEHFVDIEKRLASPYHSLYCRMSYELKLAAVHYKEGNYEGCSHHLDAAVILLDTAVFKGNDNILFDIEVCTLQAKLDDVTSEGGEKTLMLWSRVMSMKRNMYEKDDGEEMDTHPELVSTMVHLATVLIDIGDLKSAHSLATQAFSIRNEYYEDSHPALAVCYFLKANYLRKLGNFNDAMSALETCHKTMKSHFKPGHYWHAKCSLLAAEITREKGHPHLAQPLYEECLAMQEVRYEKYPLHKSILDGYVGMARNQSDLGIYDEALSWYERAVSMNEDLSLLFGVKTHCKLESCKISMGEIKVILGQIREGKELISSAGKALAEMTSDKHVTISDGLLAFGKARSLEGKYNDAHSLYLRCMDIRKDLLGPHSPAVAEVWQAIADNHRLPGSFDDAVAAEYAAMNIRSKLFLPDSIHVGNSLHSRANILRDLNKPDEAGPFYHQALDTIGNVCGEQSLLYNQVLGDYGDNLRVSRRLEEACEALQTAVSGIQAHVGKKHILNADHMRVYAQANIDLMTEDRHHIALAMLEESVLPIYGHIVGEMHPASIFTKGLIGLVEVLNMTPRSTRTADDLSQTSTPQDMVDDALDFFSNYRQRPFTALQPWVRYLGGYLEGRNMTNQHHHAAAIEANAIAEAKTDQEEEARDEKEAGFDAVFGEGGSVVPSGSLAQTSISSLGTPGF